MVASPRAKRLLAALLTMTLVVGTLPSQAVCAYADELLSESPSQPTTAAAAGGEDAQATAASTSEDAERSQPDEVPDAIRKDASVSDASSMPTEAPGTTDAAAVLDTSANASAQESPDPHGDKSQAQSDLPSEGESSDVVAVAPELGEIADEQVGSPAIEYLGWQGDVCVWVSAPEGAFPEGTSVRVSDADADRLMSASEGLLDGHAVDARAVDISFFREGTELQPVEGHDVRVSLRVSGGLGGESFSAVHLGHEGKASIVADATNDYAAFDADSFSVYGIVGENANKRVQVTFKSGEATLSTQIVHAGDTLVAPDPSHAVSQQTLYYWEVGEGDLPESFLGHALTSDDIDRMIADLGAEPISGDNIWGIIASAKFDEGYRAYFHKNARGHELAEIVADSLETDMSRSIDLSKVTFAPPDPSLKLVGWEEYDGGGSFLRRYSTNDVVTLSDDVHLYPALASGTWVSLDLSPAATQPNVFAQLVDGETSQWRLSFADLPTASDLGESYYQGYTFGGWFGSRSGTSIDNYQYEDAVTEDVTLTSPDVTLYAKWVPAEVAYSVVHWVEGPEKGPGEGDYTIFGTEAKFGTVGTEIPVTQYPEIDSDAGGYHVAGTDELGDGGSLNEQVVIVTRDGSAVKNVYHNRNRVKPTFKKLNNGAVLDPGMDARYEGYIKWGEGPDYWDPNGVIDGYLESGHSGNTYYLFSGGNTLGKTTQFSNERGWTYTYPYYPLFSLPDKTAFTYAATTTWTARSVTQDRFYFEVIEGDAGPDDIEVTYGGRTLTLRNNPERTFNENSSIQSSEWAINKNPNTTKFLFEGFSKWAYRHGVSRTNHNPIVDAFLTSTTNVRAYLGDDGLRHIDWFYARNRYTLSFANVDGVSWPEGRTQPEPQVVQYGAALSPYDPGLGEGSLRSVGGKTYEFAGWFSDAGGALSPDDPQSETRSIDFASDTMDKDTVAYAAWRPLSFTLKYESNGGTTVDPVVVESGERTVEPSTPTQSGSTFVGWFKDEACTVPWDFYTDRVTADTTLHAKWISGEPCALSYHKAGGDPVSSDVTSYYSGTRVKLDAAPSDLSQTGAFLGWSTVQGDASGLVPNTFTIYRDTDLYAVYGDAPEAAGPVVTLNQNLPDGSVSATYDLGTERTNDQVDIPAAPVGGLSVPRGYRFAGWNTEADGSGDSWQAGVPVGVSSATTLYARWEPLQMATPTLSDAYTYDGAAHKPQPLVVTEDGQQLLEGIDYTLSYERNVHPSVGDTKALVTITPTDTGKVWLADPVVLPFEIGKASLQVSARPVTITYGQPARNDGVTYDGFVEGEGSSVLFGELSYSYTRRLTSSTDDDRLDVGVYDITPSGLTSDDYQITYVPGALTVNPLALGLEWSGNLVYNGSSQRFGGATVTGLLSGDQVSVGSYEGATEATDVGTYGVRAASLEGSQAANYALPSEDSHDWQVLKASNTVTMPTIKGWAQGSYDPQVNAPHSTADFAAPGEPSYEYKPDGAPDDQYAASVPDAEGRYQVRALVAGTNNYEGATSEPATFEILASVAPDPATPTPTPSTPATTETQPAQTPATSVEQAETSPQTKASSPAQEHRSTSMPQTGDNLMGLPVAIAVLAMAFLASALVVRYARRRRSS